MLFSPKEQGQGLVELAGTLAIILLFFGFIYHLFVVPNCGDCKPISGW